MPRSRFILQEKASLSVKRLCELLEASSSACYAWIAQQQHAQPPPDNARL